MNFLVLLLSCAPKPAGPEAPAVVETVPPAIGGMSMTAAQNIRWIPMNPNAPESGQLAIVNGNPKTGPSTMLMRFPPGRVAGLHTHTNAYAAVVLTGSPIHGDSAEKSTTFSVGSFWNQPGAEIHYDACAADSTESCSFVLHWLGPQDYAPAQAPATVATTGTHTLSAEVA